MSAIKKRKLMGEINVVPYIDVMLVLLIIFMVTAPLLTPGIEVELPKAGAGALSNDENLPIVVSVDESGNLYINIGDNEEQPASAEDIVNRTRIVLNEKPGTPVLVKADRRVQYGFVVGAMVLLQQGGAENVGFVTDPLDTYPIPE
ncbi:MAG: protein TolR [Woeseiaceae bacterium]|nr:protein TolR [Woeseiaceae bacterium]